MKSHCSTAGNLPAARFVVNLHLLTRRVWRQARSCCASRWRRRRRRRLRLRWMRLRRARPRPLRLLLRVAQRSQGLQRRAQRSRTRARARRAGQAGWVQRGGQRREASAGARAPAARRPTQANCRGCGPCSMLSAGQHAACQCSHAVRGVSFAAMPIVPCCVLQPPSRSGVSGQLSLDCSASLAASACLKLHDTMDTT